MIPIFLLQENPCRRDVEKARDVGATDVLTTPISPKTIITKLRKSAASLHRRQRILRPRPPRRISPAYHGSDRRNRAPRKAKVDFTIV